jgi:hypothetical protein
MPTHTGCLHSVCLKPNLIFVTKILPTCRHLSVQLLPYLPSIYIHEVVIEIYSIQDPTILTVEGMFSSSLLVMAEGEIIQ